MIKQYNVTVINTLLDKQIIVAVFAANSDKACDEAFDYSDKLWNIQDNNWIREHTELYADRAN